MFIPQSSLCNVLSKMNGEEPELTFCSNSCLEASEFSFKRLETTMAPVCHRILSSAILAASFLVVYKSVWLYAMIHWQIPPHFSQDDLWGCQIQSHLSAILGCPFSNPFYVVLFCYLLIYMRSAAQIKSNEPSAANQTTLLGSQRFLHGPDITVFPHYVKTLK